MAWHYSSRLKIIIIIVVGATTLTEQHETAASFPLPKNDLGGEGRSLLHNIIVIMGW